MLRFITELTGKVSLVDPRRSCCRAATGRWPRTWPGAPATTSSPSPLAAGVLAFAGITLSPAVGAILMSASTVVVAFNPQLLRRLDIRPTQAPTSDAAPEAARSGAGHA